MEEVVKQGVKQGFTTSPATVYGVLVGFAMVIILGMGFFVYFMYKKNELNRVEANKERKEREEATNNRFRQVHENYSNLQKEYIEVLTNVVQANTLSNNELVAELKSHRELTQKTLYGIEEIRASVNFVKDKLS